MNNKGQALIEFVLILPISIMILFAIIDFGLIFSNKCTLENESADIIEFLKNDTDIDSIKQLYKDIDITVTDNTEYYDITITKKVKIFNFGLERILHNPYSIQVERYIPHE